MDLPAFPPALTQAKMWWVSADPTVGAPPDGVRTLGLGRS